MTAFNAIASGTSRTMLEGEPSPTPTNPFAANVWVNTNRVSSDNLTQEVILQGLPEGAQELAGTYAVVDGKTKLGGVFKWGPFPVVIPPTPPPASGSETGLSNIRRRFFFETEPAPGPTVPTPSPESATTVTTDGFDQVQLYHTLTSTSLYLKGLGIDLPAILGRRHGGTSHPITGHANAFEDMNAYYSPTTDDVSFGTSDGKWHLASDSDVVIHEATHEGVDHANEHLMKWYAKHGRRIHEGLADAGAAGIADDPELSEDFPPALGEPADKGKGLRTVNNALKLSDVSEEEHDGGQVYGGFFWGLKKRFESNPGVDSRKAADLMLRLQWAHVNCYRTRRPESADFVKAVLGGAEALAAEGSLPLPLATLRQYITDEAIAREMIRQASDVEEREQPVPAFALQGAVQELAGKSPSMRFEFAKTTKGRGGVRHDYQQYYVTSDGQKARVLGNGFFLHQNTRGQTFLWKNDVRTLQKKTGFGAVAGSDVVEQRRFSPDAALQAAQQRAAAELQRTTALRQQVDRIPIKTRKDFIAHKEADVAYRVALAAFQKSQRITPAQNELVILPGEHELSYEFSMGLALYYVNAQTGRVRVEENVLWD